MRKLKRFLFVILLLAGLFAIWVEVANRNSKNMTYRQKILKTIYPAFMWLNRVTGKRQSTMQQDKIPPMSFYDLRVTLNNGKELSFADFKGKKVLLVNTASNCGYTNQYTDLQKLYEQEKQGLVIIGFPANDFLEQEKGSDDQIAEFCKLNYGVSFPMFEKIEVNGKNTHPIFKYLKSKLPGSFFIKTIKWNFTKFVIDKNGKAIKRFSPTTGTEEIKEYLQKIL